MEHYKIFKWNRYISRLQNKINNKKKKRCYDRCQRWKYRLYKFLFLNFRKSMLVREQFSISQRFCYAEQLKKSNLLNYIVKNQIQFFTTWNMKAIKRLSYDTETLIYRDQTPVKIDGLLKILKHCTALRLSAHNEVCVQRTHTPHARAHSHTYTHSRSAKRDRY